MVSRRPEIGLRVRAWAVLPLQIVFSGTILAVAAFGSFVASGEYDGMVSLVFWPLSAVMMASYSLAGALLIGLPIRIVPPLTAWWARHWWFAAAGIVVGVVLLVGSWFWGSAGPATASGEFGIEYEFFAPDRALLFGGWSLLAFSSVHCWWPRRGRRAGRADARP